MSKAEYFECNGLAGPNTSDRCERVVKNGHEHGWLELMYYPMGGGERVTIHLCDSCKISVVQFLRGIHSRNAEKL